VPRAREEVVDADGLAVGSSSPVAPPGRVAAAECAPLLARIQPFSAPIATRRPRLTTPPELFFDPNEYLARCHV